MLDTDTKRRIDSARDILVGKVPDPKSQVEQITIALIYKFMDDMDAEAEELGGKRKFFAGQFARYGWAKLMHAGLGGFETLNLYAEGITKMPENPGIPPLFRDIFKNAYLPYRDPETLKMFLKTIDGFTYEHSERLGDAFEYLLSVLGSQGDAGQFRTPRHIIDFIVAIVDPKKNETILDPACGTAGFLISSYKHILAANRANMDRQDGQDEREGPEAANMDRQDGQDEREGPETANMDRQDGQDKTGESGASRPSMFSTLTPDERGRLANNLKGYDISPDMVRLSLVNMYLHGFAEPHIYEYDTLASLDKWNEYADVILANPPFMSPKGGIMPHNRFSVQSKRSEVLFVDYMAEHLTPTGRAGIIVPQGILTEQTSGVRRLRSKLINECGLDAVITLPVGCFRPYADAETAILILRKRKEKTSVWFYELSHDGFTPDDRRTPILENDIPELLALWPNREDSTKSFSVTIEEIKAHGESLSLGEYKKDHLAIAEGALPNGWRVERLDALVEEVNVRAGSDHRYPVLSVTKYHGFVQSSSYFKKRVFSEDTSDYKLVERGQFAYSTIHLDEGSIGYLDKCDAGVVSPMYKVFRLKVPTETVHPSFLFWILKAPALMEKYRTLGKGSVKRRKSVSFTTFAAISIPIPPQGIQQKVVEHIETVQALEGRLETAREQLTNEIESTLRLVGLAQPEGAE
jgi:type I restriction-modification system DNA methylase subunit